MTERRPPKIRGLYRLKTATGMEWVLVDYGIAGKFEITCERYEQMGYEPAFDSLPTKAQFAVGEIMAKSRQ
ncbi:hypothetical protein [Labrys miyagiensis]|nr:hypothetical protein [Labrys miyagiensis]